jgi:hypothetical protein
MNDIVEESSKDNFWGAFRIDEQKLVGVNALGRLLMELREVYQSQERYNLLYAPAPSIKNFLLMGREVEPVDERKRFIATILNSWEKRGMEVEQLSSSIAELDSDHTQTESISDIKQEQLEL